jgi:flagellar FliL protein
MAIVLINTILTGVLIFVIVPTSNKTTQLVSKVASIVDLELESPDASDAKLTVSDMTNYDITDELTINLKSSGDGKSHYALIKTVTLTMNNKHEDFKDLSPLVETNVNIIKGIITDEVSKYTFDEANNQKDAIKQAILEKVQELFQSDFIIQISFANMVLQ